MGHRQARPSRRCCLGGTVTGQSRRLLIAALSAAGRGWPVFPLQPYGKRPAIKDWPHRATCDDKQLAVWWGLAPYNIGIACGPAGLLVLDLDHRPSTGRNTTGPVDDGADVFAEFARRYGAVDPQDTFTVVTPSGEHRYFTVPDRQTGRTTAGLLGVGIDTRAAGGYVVGAGSMRWCAGRRCYYRVSRADIVKPVPVWLLQALTPPPPAIRGSATVARPGAYARAAVEREAATVRTAVAGTRNSCLFGAAVRLGQLTATGLIAEPDATGALLRAADRHVGVDGFTAAEATRAIRNGLAYGRRRPRKISGTDW